MDFWEILGLEPTKSQEEIVSAYRTKLEDNNPEDNPEGFMALRSAYDEALKYSKAVEKEDIYAPLLEQAANLYSHIRRRGDVSLWQNLLEDPLFQQIDTRHEAEHRLILFFMDNYRLPQKVFQRIAENFHWENREEELKEHYPPGYIDYIFDVIQNGEYLRHDLFDGDDYAEYDRFIERCLDFANTISDNPEQAQEIMEEIDALEIYHPYYNVEKVRFYWARGDMEACIALTEDFEELYPENEYLLSLRLDILNRSGVLDQGEGVAEKLRVISPDVRPIKLYDILQLGREDVVKAKDEYYDFVKSSDYREDCDSVVKMLNQQLIPLLEQKEDISQMETITLAWAYFEEDNAEKAYELLCSFEANTQEVLIKQHKLKGFLEIQSNQYEEGLKNIESWEELTRTKREAEGYIPEPGDHMDDVAMVHAKYQAYDAMGNTQKVEECLRNLIELSPRDLEHYVALNHFLMDYGRYQEAANLNKEAMSKNGDVEILLVLTGVAEYKMEHYADALSSFDAARELTNDEQWISLHYRLLIFDGWNWEEPFESTLEYLKNCGNQEMLKDIVALHESKLLRFKKELNTARTKIDQLVQEVEEKQNQDQPINKEEQALIYQEAATIYRERQDYPLALEFIRKAKALNIYSRNIELDEGYLLVLSRRYEEAEQLYQNLASRYPEDSVYYIRLGATQSKLKKYEEAIESYKKGLLVDPERYDIYSYIGDIYDEMGDNKSCIEYKTLAVEKDPTFENYYDRACGFYRQGFISKTKEDLQAAIDLNPYNSDALTFLGMCYIKEKNYEKAQEYYDKAMEYFDYNEFLLNTPMYRVAKYYREKNYEEAKNTLLQAFDALGYDGGGWATIRLAEAYQLLGNYQEGDSTFKTALEHNPQDTVLQLEYAAHLYKTGRGQEGMRFLEQQLQSNEAIHYANAGLYAYLFMLDFEKAEKFYQSALDRDKIGGKYAYINYFEAQWYILRTKNGIIHPQMKLQRPLRDARQNKMLINHFKERVQNSLNYFEKFGHYWEKTSHEFALLAEACYYAGDLANAKKMALLSIDAPMEDFSLVDTDADALYILGMVYEEEGELEKALECFNHIVDTRWGFALFNVAKERVEKKIFTSSRR